MPTQGLRPLVRTQIGFQTDGPYYLRTEINKFLDSTISTTLMTLEVSVNRTEALPGLSEDIGFGHQFSR